MLGIRGTLLALATVIALSGGLRAQEPEDLVGPPAPERLADPDPTPRVQNPSTPPENPPQEPAPTPPVYLFLNAASDLNDLLSKLSKPDFVLVEWAKYQALMEKAGAEKPASEPIEDVVNAVDLHGSLDLERARIEVEYRIVTASEGVNQVRVALNGQVLGEATEEGRPVRLHAAPDGGWMAELNGRGEHHLLIRFSAPVRSTAEGSRLDLLIPEAASTRLDLSTRTPVIEARLGGEESIPVEPDDDGKGSRLSAYLSPRSRLELSWRTRSVEGPVGPALLTAQGEIAIEVQRGVLQASATYEIRSERGTARSLALKLDPDDELLALEIDGKSAKLDTPDAEPGEPLTLSLPDPIRPDSPLKVQVKVRRPLPAGGPAPVTFRGFPLVGVAVQSGLIAVSQSGDLWVSGSPGRSLRQVDPRSDLPQSLRVQPSYVLAYQFLDQPFELALQVDPSPPWVRVESKTTLSLSSGDARIDERLDYRISRGRLFDLRIAIPPGLELESVGPDSVIESAEQLPSDPTNPDRPGKTLILPLTQAARDAASFSIRLVGRQRIEPSETEKVGLYEPLDASWRGGSVAVIAARNLTVDLAPGDRVWPSSMEFPSNWPWPSERPSGRTTPALWLQHGGEVRSIPLKIVTHERAFEHESTLDVVVDRHRVDYRQEVDARVHFGSVSQLELAVPPTLSTWELEGVDLARRERLKELETGDVLYRLTFARELADRFRLKFRARQERASESSAPAVSTLTLRPIRILDGTRRPGEIRVSPAPGVELQVDGPGWTRAPESEAVGSSSETALPVQWTWNEPGEGKAEARLSVRLQQMAALPRTVASRVWLRSEIAPDGSVRSMAWYRLDVHESSVSIALPEGAEWISARAGEDTIPEVEKLAEQGSYRLRLPPQAAPGPLPLILEYLEPARDLSRSWKAPRLLGSSAVQQSFWEIRMPASRALVGVPRGWTDENQWYWDLYVWKRRPRLSPLELSNWIAGLSGRQPAAEAEPTESRLHSYLFSRSGEPGSIRPSVLARPWLVAGFSGSVLVVGLLVLSWKPRAWAVLAAFLTASLALGAAVEPSVLFLGLQSSALGAVLLGVAFLLQRSLDRRHGSSSMIDDQRGLEPGRDSAPRQPGALTPAPDLAGSEGSTVIRPRPGTTIEHVHQSPASVPEPARHADRSG